MDSSDHTRHRQQVDRKYNVEKEHKSSWWRHGVLYVYKARSSLRRRTHSDNHPHQPTFRSSQNNWKILCLIMSAPSPSSSRPLSHSSLYYDLPTIGELNRIIRNQNFFPYIEQRFQNRSRTTSQFLHFMSLSRTIQQLEASLQDYYNKQEALFINLQDDETFQRWIQPICRYYQQIYPRRQATPYQRSDRSTNSSPTSSNSARSRIEVTILDIEAPVPASPNSSFSSDSHRNASPRFTVEAADALLISLAPPSPPSLTPTSSSSSYRSVISGSLLLGTPRKKTPLSLRKTTRISWCALDATKWDTSGTTVILLFVRHLPEKHVFGRERQYATII